MDFHTIENKCDRFRSHVVVKKFYWEKAHDQSIRMNSNVQLQQSLSIDESFRW